MTADVYSFYCLSVALALGLLIGVERGWQARKAGEGTRIAGVRTFGLLGLLGGTLGLLSQSLGALAIGLPFLGLAGVLTAVYVANLSASKDVGITGLVAGLLTFVLGALAGVGEVALAAAFAVLTTLLLDYKPILHRWLDKLESQELRAAYILLLISVVLLPVLPNRGYGPWQVLNPYQIWWMVVLVAAISFTGYFAIKIGGARRGAIFTGLFGGLASSTALTMHFSRMAKTEPAMAAPLASGILIACGTMYLRMTLVASILNPALTQALLLPACAMALLAYGPALAYWLWSRNQTTSLSANFSNPLDIRTAIVFGLFLALVMLFGRALQNWFGDSGILALAAASGVADVDAITLSLAGMSRDGIAVNLASAGIIVAAAVNSLVKAGMAATLGGLETGWRVGLPLLAASITGFIIAWQQIG